MQFAAEKEVIHSWQKIDPASARYPPEITPLILAAQRNNYEILKLLLDRGATLPMPHDIRCGCADCLRSTIGKTNRNKYLFSFMCLNIFYFRLDRGNLFISRIRLKYTSLCTYFTKQEINKRRNCLKF